MNSVQSQVKQIGQIVEINVYQQTLLVRVESFFGVAHLPAVRYASVYCCDDKGNKIGRRFSVQVA